MWNVVGASVTGTSHLTSELPCQDFADHSVFTAKGEQHLIMAVSDGAGSASQSHIGSKIAVGAAIRTLSEILQGGEACSETTAVRVLEVASAEIENVAKAASIGVREYACTLLFAVVTAECAFFAQLGDGGWVVEENGSLSPVTWPHRGEYANETFFLCSRNWRDGFQFSEITRPISAVAGFTDGIQPVALQYATRSAHGPFFWPLFKVVKDSMDSMALKPALEGFLNVKALNERTDDDKTLLLAVRRPLKFLEWTSSTKTESR